MRLYPRIKHLMVTLWLPISLSLGGMACSNAKRHAGHLTKPTNRSRTIKTPPKNNADSAEAPTLPHSAGSSISDSPSITPMSYGDGRPSSADNGGSSPSSSGPPSGHASSSGPSSAYSTGALGSSSIGSGGSAAYSSGPPSGHASSSGPSPTSSGTAPGSPTPQSLAEAQVAVDKQAQQALHCGGTFGPCLQDSWKSLQAAIIAAKRLAPSDQQLVYEEAVQAAGRVVSCKEDLNKKEEAYRIQQTHLRNLSRSSSEYWRDRRTGKQDREGGGLLSWLARRKKPEKREPISPPEGDAQDHSQEHKQAKREQTEANQAVLQSKKALEECKVDALEKLKALPGFTSKAPTLLQEVEEALEKSRSAIAAHEREIVEKGGGGTSVRMRHDCSGCG
ncbi:MAG: hypothetical protein ROO73_05245 [Roseivirga sp.]